MHRRISQEQALPSLPGFSGQRSLFNAGGGGDAHTIVGIQDSLGMLAQQGAPRSDASKPPVYMHQLAHPPSPGSSAGDQQHHPSPSTPPTLRYHSSASTLDDPALVSRFGLESTQGNPFPSSPMNWQAAQQDAGPDSGPMHWHRQQQQLQQLQQQDPSTFNMAALNAAAAELGLDLGCRISLEDVINSQAFRGLTGPGLGYQASYHQSGPHGQDIFSGQGQNYGQQFGGMSGGQPHLRTQHSQRNVQFNVYDMKSLAAALGTVQAGTGEIRQVLQSSTFRPRLPGLTKLVSQLTREGNWQKGLEVFETLDVIGVRPDTTITNAAISACDKGGHWEKAMQVFYNMDDAGLRRDAITYSAVISALSKGRQWSMAIDVFNHMCDAGIECDAVTCCSLITALDKGGQWQLAEQVFIQMYTDHPQFKVLLQCMVEDAPTVACTSGQELFPAPPPSDSLAAAPSQAGALTPASLAGAALTAELGQAPADSAPWNVGVSVSVGTDTPGKKLSSTGSMSRIDEELPNWKPRRSAELQPSPVGGCASPHAQDKAAVGSSMWSPLSLTAGQVSENLWGRADLMRAPSPGLAARPQTPSSTQSASGVKRSSLDLPPGSHAGLQPAGLSALSPEFQPSWLPVYGEPRPDLQGQAVGMYAPAGAGLQRTTSAPPGQQRSLLRTASLNTKKNAPNRVCCNALLAAYARAQPTQWQKAIRLLDLMWYCGGELCPDIVSYNTVIKACGNAQQIDLGFKVYHIMCKRGVEPTVATFGTLICIASDTQQSRRVKEAWGWLRSSGLEVHVTCANAYLQALIKEGNWEDAQRVFTSMQQPHGPVHPNVVTFAIMMGSYLAQDKPHQVKRLFEDMLSCGVQPNASIYSLLCNAYAQRGLWEDAINILSFMCRPASNLKPPVSTFTGIFLLARTAALGAEDENSRRQIVHRLATIRALLKSCCSPAHHSGSPGMRQVIPAEAGLFHAMIGAYQAAGECDTVMELFNMMVNQNVAVDGEIANLVLAAICISRKWDKVLQVLQTLQEQQGGHTLPLPVLLNILMEMTNAQAWIPTYKTLKAWMVNCASLHSAQRPATPTTLMGPATPTLWGTSPWSSTGGGSEPSTPTAPRSSQPTVAAPAPMQLGLQPPGRGLLSNGSDSPDAASRAQLGSQAQAASAQPPRSSGLEAAPSTLQLLDMLKAEGHMDLLFMALLVVHESSGSWKEALKTFTRMQTHQTPFSQSQEVHTIMFELMFVHGGVEGLAQAVLLCKRAHEAGQLAYYKFPWRSLSQQAAARGAGEADAEPRGDGAGARGAEGQAGGVPNEPQPGAGRTLVLEGESRIQAIVVLLSWLLCLSEHARAKERLALPLVEIIVLGSPDCLDMHPLKTAVSMVLGAGYLQHLRLEDCSQEQRDVFVLRRPVRCFEDPGTPATVYVDVQSLYRALAA